MQDTDSPPALATPDQAGKAQPSLPWRVRLSLWRQKTILTVRWWFRVPMDDIKEADTKRSINHLLELNKTQLKTMRSVAQVLTEMESRLKFYEQHIPRMRELRREYEMAQLTAKKAGADKHADLNNGILPLRAKLSGLLHAEGNGVG